MQKSATFRVPAHVTRVTMLLENASFPAYLVGGCVRDLVMGRVPKDYDITTNARPEDIIRVFEPVTKVVYENTFGTVALVFEDEPLESPVRTIEITPYRTDGDYKDYRHPEEVTFGDSLEDDLARRDFTMNALALRVQNATSIAINDTLHESKGQNQKDTLAINDIEVAGEITDIYGGIDDIKARTVKAVGDPEKRFEEDALRVMRAVRFAAELNFNVSRETFTALHKKSANLEHVSRERIRDEFIKIINSDNPMRGIELAQETGVLGHVSREIEEGLGVAQNKSHIYDVWEHNLRACQNAADKKWPFHVRLAALLHDVGKPRTKRFDKAKGEYTFYGHEVVGARMTEKFMKRLRFSKDLTDKVTKLVRYHMFFSDPDTVTHAAVRRLVKNIGPELIWDLMKVRRSDRIGMGRPKEAPYRLRKFEAMIEEATRAPVSVGMLKINGDVMRDVLHMKPGRRMGDMLHALLEEVLEDPARNTEEWLLERARDLDELDDAALRKLGDRGKQKRDEIENEKVGEIRKRHHVK